MHVFAFEGPKKVDSGKRGQGGPCRGRGGEQRSDGGLTEYSDDLIV